MKKIGVLVIGLILFLSLALTAPLQGAIPIGATKVGNFPAGFPCYSFMVEEFRVDVIFLGGSLNNGIALRLITSPDNQYIPTNYIFLYRASSYATEIVWDKNGKTLYFVTRNNIAEVWILE